MEWILASVILGSGLFLAFVGFAGAVRLLGEGEPLAALLCAAIVALGLLLVLLNGHLAGWLLP
jgi:hypothetical protein